MIPRAMPLAIALILLAAGSSRAQPAGPDGLWLDESGRAGIDIAACGERLCGTITWLKEPIDPDTGKPKLDKHNDDPALQSRPLCGLRMLWDFVADDPGEWSGGRIYDPDSGSTYKSHMVLRPDGTLRVRGYIGISLFGRSQVWTRPAHTLPNCAGG